MRNKAIILTTLGLAGFVLLHYIMRDNPRERLKEENDRQERAVAKIRSETGPEPISLRPTQVAEDLVAEKGASADDKPAEADQANEGFRFPDDPSGKILSKLLPPSEKMGQLPSDPPTEPRRLPALPSLEHPTASLPSAQVEVPRLPTRMSSTPKPRPLPEELPILAGRLEPVMPQARILPAGDRVRLPSVDVRQPLPLPILAKPIIDRESLDDLTSDASQAAALAAPPLVRTAPAPFIKMNLPDPFENRLKEGAVPEEIMTPVHTGSRPGR